MIEFHRDLDLSKIVAWDLSSISFGFFYDAAIRDNFVITYTIVVVYILTS